jgi:hypothetical protein
MRQAGPLQIGSIEAAVSAFQDNLLQNSANGRSTT